MTDKTYKKIPRHIGVIPDGNRRWAVEQGMEKDGGYQHGVTPGTILCQQMATLGVEEVTFYGFTKDNNKRPKYQREAFTQACVDSVTAVANQDYNILVVGNTASDLFPRALLPYTKERVAYGKGIMNINFLINYDWKLDIETGIKNKNMDQILSRGISRIDLIIRWGGQRRLSGFLPVQSVYSDFFVLDNYWPGFRKEDIDTAMTWYQSCDVTLGG